MSKSGKLKRILLWSLLILVLLLGAARVALEPLGEHMLQRWFAQQNIDTTLEGLSLDLTAGSAELTGLQAGSAANPVLRLGRLTVDWSWKALFDNRIRLNSIAIEDLFVDVERGPGASLRVAGIDPAGDEPDPVAAGQTTSEPLNWGLELGDVTIAGLKNCYRSDSPRLDYCTAFSSLEWRGDLALDLGAVATTPLPLQLQGELSLDDLAVTHNGLERSLMTLESLRLSDLRVDTLDQITLAAVEMRRLDLMQRAAGAEVPQITRLEALDLDGIGLRQLARLEIEAVDLSGHDVFLRRLQDQSFEFDPWIPVITETSDDTDNSASNPDATGFSWAIGRIHYRTEAALRFEDTSLDPVLLVDLNNIELVIENLDSTRPDASSRIEYSAKYATHGQLSLQGTATPLAARPSFAIDGRIEGLDLRDLSPFSASAIGHGIKSGQLNADLTLRADAGVLDSVIDLTLNQFSLEALSSEDQEALDTSLGFPLNASLSLLKDRDNRIQLEIPITGDLDNPDFDPSDAIRQATSTAITAAVLNYYTPFGLVTLADGLFSLATALSFDPVAFEVGDADLTRVDADGLEKIAELMRERPGVHVTLCAFTNSADRIALLPDTAEIAVDELELDETQQQLLSELGEGRAAGIKDYLVTREIDPARLVLCSSEHVEGEGLGGVEISI